MRISSEVTAGQCLFCLFSVFVDVCEAAGDMISRTRSRGPSIAGMFADVLVWKGSFFTVRTTGKSCD